MNRHNALSLLGLKADANKDDIKKAYRKAAGIHHPDKGGDGEKFKEIKAAYEFLESNVGHSSNSFDSDINFDFNGFKNADFQEALRRYRNTGYYEHSNSAKNNIPTFTAPVNLTLEEAFKGVTTTQIFRVPHNPNETFTETFVIPPGIKHGQVIKKSKIAKSQEVYAEFTAHIDTGDNHISWQPRLQMNGTDVFISGDIFANLEVSPLKLMRGGWEEYKTIDGRTIKLRIPAGMQSGKTLKVQGRGYWKTLDCDSRGDVLLSVVADIKPLNKYDRDELTECLEFVADALKTTMTEEEFSQLKYRIFPEMRNSIDC